MKNIRGKAHIGLIHIGKREKSGLQIFEKLKQNNFTVKEWDVHDGNDSLNGLDEVSAIIVNVGVTNFEYDVLLGNIFEKDIKIIINEASLTNQLSGVKRQSWERHLLNKIDSSFSVIPRGNNKRAALDHAIDFKKFGIDEVWVLAASIGGPEAIQSFLSEFKGNENILFIIVQHIDKEFLDNMAQQFNLCCDFVVEVPVSGMKIVTSKCIINPTDEYINFDEQGLLELDAINEVFPFSPCIDECCKRLVKNIKNLNMAIFSGMSTDGIEAAKTVKNAGNKVITQKESSCVLSTIIAGVKKEIEINFEGTPAEMAKYIINDSKKFI